MRRFGFDNRELNELKSLIEAKRVERVLSKNLKSIRHVNDWCSFANISKTKLYKITKYKYKLTPKRHLMLFRFHKIKALILEDPTVSAKIVAYKVGLDNEQSLYKFLIRNFETNFTSLKTSILTQLFVDY